MFQAFTLSLAQLGDPRIRSVLVKSVLLTLLLFAAAAALAASLLTGTNPCGIGPLDYRCTIDGQAGAAIAVLLGLASWFLFPAVAIGVLGIFADDVVEAVEARHYPQAAAAARRPTVGEGLALGLRSAGRLALWDLLAMPGYVLLLVTGIGPFALFFATMPACSAAISARWSRSGTIAARPWRPGLRPPVSGARCSASP
ncbi:MAG: CysZ protein [Sphingomonadales bacterium]|jgi:uncharacterized protein involved in cysteine biosynthesis|nr:CysZ protein [Sphingomonadales bacterium]